jgi:hypothetical protein
MQKGQKKSKKQVSKVSVSKEGENIIFMGDGVLFSDQYIEQ